jgi:hypothetical protein
MNQALGFRTGDVLLVVDVFNDFEHEDGDRLVAFRATTSGMRSR